MATFNFDLELSTDNAAFEPLPGAELRRIRNHGYGDDLEMRGRMASALSESLSTAPSPPLFRSFCDRCDILKSDCRQVIRSDLVAVECGECCGVSFDQEPEDEQDGEEEED